MQQKRRIWPANELQCSYLAILAALIAILPQISAAEFVSLVKLVKTGK